MAIASGSSAATIGAIPASAAIATRLGAGGEREDRGAGGEVLEELEVDELRAGWLREQEQRVGLALERQRDVALERAEQA